MNRHDLRRNILLVAVQAAMPLCSGAAEPTTKPAARLDPAIERILDRQEARGKSLRDLRCDLEYIKEDKVLEDKQTLTGKLRFGEAEPNPMFWIQFDKHDQEGIKTEKKEWHVFDGRFYIEARESTQTIVKHEVLRKGEKKNVFKLGEGPFPVPFGQKKKDIVETFTIELVPPAPGDPPSTDHLKCTPRPGSDIDKRYGTVHFWIDRNDDLPVKLSTIQKEEDKEVTARFTNLKINPGMAASELNLPELPDYKITEDRLPPPETPSSANAP